MNEHQTNFESNGHTKSPFNNILEREDDDKFILSTTESEENEHKKTTVDSLLKIEDDDETSKSELEDDDSDYSVEEEEDPALVQTKHSIVNSPYTRFGVVGGGVGVVAFLIYLFLVPIMNGDLAKKKEVLKVAATPSASEEKKEPKKDGDVYAKLALQRQADELAKLNSQTIPKESKPTISENKDKIEKLPKTPTKSKHQIVATTPAPPQRRVVSSPPPHITRSPFSPFSPSPPIPKPQVAPARSQTEVAALPDPQSELERLRSLGSAGQIYYMANVVSTDNGGNSNQIDHPVNTGDTDYIPRRRTIARRNSRIETTKESTSLPSSDSTTSSVDRIEQLKPRWTPVASVVASNGDELNDTNNSGNYSPEEAGIIQGKQEQYLVAGENAAATLETPLIWSSGSRSSDTQPQFVARLTEPLKSNTGEEAIPAGTLLSVEMQGVDASGRAIAQVTAILQNGSEYPVSKGAIALLGEGGNPLIANQYHDKGGEIFGLDTGLGLVSGLAKVGEIINQADVQTSISQSGGGFSSVQTSSNGRRSIGAAFLSGAFGALSEQVKARNQKAIEEIIKRPNIWFVKKGTKILVTVNRSIQL